MARRERVRKAAGNEHLYQGSEFLLVSHWFNYPRVDYKGDDPLGYIISTNLRRPHLNVSQRAMIAATLTYMPLGGVVYRKAKLPTDLLSREKQPRF